MPANCRISIITKIIKNNSNPLLEPESKKLMENRNNKRLKINTLTFEVFLNNN